MIRDLFSGNLDSSGNRTVYDCFCRQLQKPVKADGNVESWLMQLMKMSHHSLHCVIRTAAIAVQDSGFQLLQFLNMFPAQVQNRRDYTGVNLPKVVPSTSPKRRDALRV